LAGIIEKFYNSCENLNSVCLIIPIFGPHLKPEFLKEPVRCYFPNLDKNKIGLENKNKTIIYQ
jgi:hypothetical protein